MGVKKSEISITESDGWFQVVIRNSCVTEPFRSADAAYRDYIKQLIDAKENAEAHLSSVSTW